MISSLLAIGFEFAGVTALPLDSSKTLVGMALCSMDCLRVVSRREFARLASRGTVNQDMSHRRDARSHRAAFVTWLGTDLGDSVMSGQPIAKSDFMQDLLRELDKLNDPELARRVATAIEQLG